MKPMLNWPGASVDLLLRATLAPDEIALPAWRRWSARQDLAGIGAHEIKVLSALGPRLARLDPAARLRRPIEELVRQHWLYMQMKLREAFPALDVLSGAGVPVIVFKGGAQYAEGLAAQSRRLMGDLDLLVPTERSTAALAALEAEGWEHVDGTSVSYLQTAEAGLRRGNLRKGRFGEIDFHLTPFHHSRRSPELDAGLWERAVPATLAGRAILVPCPTDSLAITLAHGARGQGGGWALDAMARMEHQAIDWDGLVRTAREHALVLPCRACLVYLRQELRAPIPAEVITALESSPVSLGETLKYRSFIRDWESRRLSDKVADRAANWLLRREGFSLPLDGRPVRPSAMARWSFIRGKAVSVPGMEPKLRHAIEMGAPEGRGQCVVSIQIEPPAERREIYIEVFARGRSVARLGFACGGGAPGGAAERHFRFPLPPGSAASTTLTLVSRPSAYRSPDLPAAERQQIEPIPFRVTAAWWL